MQMMRFLVGQIFMDIHTKIDLVKELKLGYMIIGPKIIMFHQRKGMCCDK